MCNNYERDDSVLKKMAMEIRLLALEGIHAAGSGHTGGSLSVAEILSVLLFHDMQVNLKQPEDPDRDRLVLSKGHAAPAYYAALALKGFFPKEDMKGLRQVGSHLQGHPSMVKTKGVDMSTGSLGQGLSAANGMAMAGKYHGKDYTVYCICGDGELQEGQIWEAAMTSAHYKLDNLVLFVDHNHLQIDGRTEEVMNVEPIGEKFQAFGWDVDEIDGHDVKAIKAAVTAAKGRKGVPSVIVCNTVKGKGVSFMENQAVWHGLSPDDDQYERAVMELTAMETEKERRSAE
ncbi:transketolase [Lacrimispora indolis]|uniref:transketolase n=1 Tax=Lacrimispora indolis TaxID=69825 RepID=UPI00045EBC27|nr:transketolase [Lacrimispora indolis]